jgi:hypothetical protein
LNDEPDWYGFMLSSGLADFRSPFSSIFRFDGFDFIAKLGETIQEIPGQLGEYAKKKMIPPFLKIYRFAECKLLEQWRRGVWTIKYEHKKLEDISVRSFIKDQDFRKAIALGADEIFPEYLRKVTNRERFCERVCSHLKPSQGRQRSKEILENAIDNEKSIVRVSRFVLRTEGDLLEVLKKSTGNLKIEFYAPTLDRMIEGSKQEFEWLSKKIEDDNLEKDETKEILKHLGLPSDPIYIWRVDGEYRPHVLGNLLQRLFNLNQIGILHEEGGIDLTSDQYQFWQYDNEYKFGGTMVYDKADDTIEEGLALIKFKGGPGQVGGLYEIGEAAAKEKVHKDETREAAVDFQTSVRKKSRMDSLSELREEILKTRREVLTILDDNDIIAILNPDDGRKIGDEIKTTVMEYDPSNPFSGYKGFSDSIKTLKTELCDFAIKLE